jgi:hypothetical protein
MLRSTDTKKYLVPFYTFYLKQLAVFFILSEVIQFRYQLYSFWTFCIVFIRISGILLCMLRVCKCHTGVGEIHPVVVMYKPP